MDSKLVISLISLVFSCISLAMSIYNFWSEMMRLKIDILDLIPANDTYVDAVIVHCIISNRSKNQITINSIDLISDNVTYMALVNSIFISSIGVEIFEQETKWEDNSIELPLKLGSYDGTETAIIFPMKKFSDLSSKIKIVLKTSRGKKTVILNKNKNYCDNRTN